MLYFGEIVDGEMQLSRAGEIVAEEWLRSTDLRSEISLDQWVIMPNHVHGIIIIEENETCQRHVSTNAFGLKASSLGSVINQFKGKCTKRILKSGYPEFTWQARYFDHVIRSDKSLQKIRDYIVENPLKWELDEYYLSGG